MHVRSRNRGFTLMEVMTAVAILAILVALSATAMMYGLGRARVSNTLFDISALYSVAQLRAISQGNPHYVFIFLNTDGRIRATIVERPETPPVPAANWANLDLSQGPGAAIPFDEFDPASGNTNANRDAFERDGITLAAGSGPDGGGIRFIDLDSPIIDTTLAQNVLPPPFSAIQVTTPNHTATEGLNQPTGELLAGCSFCIQSGNSQYGVVRFNTNGTVDILTGPDNQRAGGVIGFMTNTDDANDVGFRLLVISTPAGSVRVF